MYDYGIDEIADLIEVGIKFGIVNKSGAWFNLIDLETGEVVTDEEGKEIKVQGQANLVKLLKEDEILLDELRDQINSRM
jgi:hypothetical protein